MRKFLTSILVILIAITGFYVWRVAETKGNTSWDVALLGPGRTPEQCVARMQPWFDEHEPVMTEIAERLVSDAVISELLFYYSHADNVSQIVVEARASDEDKLRIDLTDEEEAFFRPRLESIGMGYYSPFRYRYRPAEAEGNPGVVFASSNMQCGATLAGWIVPFFGIRPPEPSRMNGKTPLFNGDPAHFAYYPSGIPEEKAECSEDMYLQPDFAFCSVPLTDKWVGATEVWPDDFYKNPGKYATPDFEQEE